MYGYNFISKCTWSGCPGTLQLQLTHVWLDQLIVGHFIGWFPSCWAATCLWEIFSFLTFSLPYSGMCLSFFLDLYLYKERKFKLMQRNFFKFLFVMLENHTIYKSTGKKFWDQDAAFWVICSLKVRLYAHIGHFHCCSLTIHVYCCTILQPCVWDCRQELYRDLEVSDVLPGDGVWEKDGLGSATKSDRTSVPHHTVDSETYMLETQTSWGYG